MAKETIDVQSKRRRWTKEEAWSGRKNISEELGGKKNKKEFSAVYPGIYETSSVTFRKSRSSNTFWYP